MINYFTSNKEVRDAWFKFKRECPDRAISVSSFVAGYNAATPKVIYCECGNKAATQSFIACWECMQ